MKNVRTAIIALFSMLGLACKDSPTGPPVVATVTLAVPSPTPFAGTSQTLVATTRAANGTVLTGRAVAWSSSNTFVANVGASGEVAAFAPGATTITATSEGKSATVALTVLPAPVATIAIVNTGAPIFVSETRQFVAVLRDANAAIVTGRIVTWTSSNPSAASMSTDGLLTAITPGEVIVTATSEGKSVTATLSVAALPDAPVISSVAESELVPGSVATINGVGFSANIGDNRVTIRGVNAPVASASLTRLTVTVPCVSSGVAPVSVATSGRASASVTHPVSVTRRTIAIGQALVLTSSAASACNELSVSAGNARYLVAVFNAATSANTLVNYEIAGNTPLIPATSPTALRTTIATPTPGVRTFTRTAEEQRDEARDDAHWQHLERERTAYERLRSAVRGAPMSTRPLRDAVIPVVGDLREFYFTFTGGCADVSRPMQTKAVYVGTRSIIWEDGTNVLLSANNPDLASYYERLGQIFDQDQYTSLKNTFGDPLLRDSLTDGDGRINMVFSQKLNGSGAAAYVTFCDQYPRSVNPGSNFGEVFYGAVPILPGSGISSTNFPDGWFYFMARTVVHEVKHIVSHAARVKNNAPVLESSWLEEGTARHAEEVWIRESLHHVPWKGNTGFGNASTNGIYCDFHPADGTCNAADLLRRPGYGMRRQFNEIRDKLIAPWDWSPYGDGTGQTGSVFYQTAWSLVRYTVDRYATSDATFFKTLINSSTNGTVNLAATAGVSLDQLIGGWGLALFADDYPGLVAPSADLQFPTWNLRNIYAGLNASPAWTVRFNSAFPIQPAQLSFGGFVLAQGGLRGGAHAYYEFSGTSSVPQLIQLRALSGGAPSANLRIAIARLQ